MITRILIAGVAIAALSTGASAHKTRHHHASRVSTYAAPAQPIPYAELDHYLKASRAERKSIEMAAAANTGTTANTAATTSETSAPATTDTTTAPPAATPPTATPDTGAVNPPNPSTTMGGAAGGGTSNDTMTHTQPH
ncbi:MAG TPA: hypothetical protein VGI30_00695 [Caulobacteraceae bacterium]